MGFDYYSDGIGLTKEATSARHQSFLTGDGWFIYNLVTNLTQRQAQSPRRVLRAPGQVPARAADIPSPPDVDTGATAEPRTVDNSETHPVHQNRRDSEVASPQIYVIYEDDPTNRARIHTINCRYYVGRREETLPDNRWHHGPHTLKAAESVLRDLGKRDSGYCQRCLRGMR